MRGLWSVSGRPVASPTARRTLGGLQNKEAQSIALGYLSQFDLMVNDATDDMCDGILSSALEGGFASLDDGNRFWLDTSRSHRRGWLTEHLLAHGGLPGRTRTWSNVLAPRDGAMVGEAEVDVPVPRERGVLVFGSRSCSGCVFGSEG